MVLRFDFEKDTPLFLQLRNQVVLAIARGEVKAGDRLPTIRALSEESGVNMMPVSKAYQLLRQEGYIHADRRSGTIVCAGEGRPPVPAKTMETLRLCLSELRLAGMDEEESLALCRRLYGESRCAARENGGKPI